MGKHKSKKHHKRSGELEERSCGSDISSELPIKLVLKVHGGQEAIVSKERKSHHDKSSGGKQKSKEHRKDKKKKKRSEEKERKKHKLEAASSSACPSPAVSSSSHRSRKRDRHEMEIQGEAFMDVEHPIKKIHIKPIEPPKREGATHKQKAKKKHKLELSALQLCLENLHITLQRKDIQGFFAYPVNDAIAPGYSRVITHPMDFSTIKTKIDSNSYTTIEAFRDDFYLMCNNAMVYNAPDTIYFKAAKRIMQIGAKMMTNDRIKNMYRSIGFPVPDMDDGRGVASDEPIDVDTVDSEVCMIMQSVKKKSKSKSDHAKTSAAGRKILAQVQEVSKRISAQLKKKYPNSKIGFLRRGQDGSTSLAVINPDSSQESLPCNLGTVVGKVATGSHITATFKEDKRNKATPVSYLMYGPFGSFAPTYDSSRATISKGESDLLYSTYGNDVGIQYARSIQDFVKNTNTFAHGVVDRLLNVLTEGAHAKLIASRQEKLKEEARVAVEKMPEVPNGKAVPESTDKVNKSADAKKSTSGPADKQENAKGASQPTSPIDVNSLLSLSDLGIDMSFLADKDSSTKFYSQASTASSSTELDSKLSSGRRLLEDLQEAQSSRLAHRPNDVQSITPDTATKPSDKEFTLAEQLTDTLKELTSQVRPADVTEVDSLRAAMGVGPLPLDTQMEGSNKDRPLGSATNGGPLRQGAVAGGMH
ncbi:bromodomain-containing protein 7 [Nematostella vectensis]|uniref:bromodomain-containing protein 7 n=1 Tax=Nematostella vectensis TaxID=45351 RepID=UPI002076DCE6|nr:bromodomain-containing protein 7 [Nematostella vectensis]